MHTLFHHRHAALAGATLRLRDTAIWMRNLAFAHAQLSLVNRCGPTKLRGRTQMTGAHTHTPIRRLSAIRYAGTSAQQPAEILQVYMFIINANFLASTLNSPRPSRCDRRRQHMSAEYGRGRRGGRRHWQHGDRRGYGRRRHSRRSKGHGELSAARITGNENRVSLFAG